MTNETSVSRFRFWLWLIALIGVIVPRRLRADWKQEWEAEFQHRELLLAKWDKLNIRTKVNLLWRSLGAFWGRGAWARLVTAGGSYGSNDALRRRANRPPDNRAVGIDATGSKRPGSLAPSGQSFSSQSADGASPRVIKDVS